MKQTRNFVLIPAMIVFIFVGAMIADFLEGWVKVVLSCFIPLVSSIYSTYPYVEFIGVSV